MSYESSRALAVRLIASKGRTDGVLRRPGASAVDPTRPWAPSAEAIDPALASGLAVVVVSASMFKDAQLSPEATAVAFLAADASPAPRPGDILETKGTRSVVLAVEDLSPGADSVLFTLQLKA